MRDYEMVRVTELTHEHFKLFLVTVFEGMQGFAWQFVEQKARVPSDPETPCITFDAKLGRAGIDDAENMRHKILYLGHRIGLYWADVIQNSVVGLARRKEGDRR
jgi:hypothetical protein